MNLQGYLDIPKGGGCGLKLIRGPLTWGSGYHHNLNCGVLLLGQVGGSVNEYGGTPLSTQISELSAEFEKFLVEGTLAQGNYQSIPGLALAAVIPSEPTTQLLQGLGFYKLHDFTNCYHGQTPMELWARDLWKKHAEYSKKIRKAAAARLKAAQEAK